MDLLKNLDNMITAEEFFYELYPDAYIEHCDIKNAMIEFAKLHVKAALEGASEKVEAEFQPIGWLADQHVSSSFIEGEDYEISISIQSILNAYSLENIK